MVWYSIVYFLTHLRGIDVVHHDGDRGRDVDVADVVRVARVCAEFEDGVVEARERAWEWGGLNWGVNAGVHGVGAED